MRTKARLLITFGLVSCAVDEHERRDVHDPDARGKLDRAAADPRISASLGHLLFRASLIDAPDPGGRAGASAEPINATPERATSTARVDVFIEGTATTSALEEVGVLPRTVVGEIMTASISLGQVPALLAIPGVSRVTAASVVELQSNVSVGETGAPSVWGGTPPSFPVAGTTGRGVVVGVVDTGIDYLHADFRTASDASRVLYAWDQRWSGRPPTGFSYGVEYTNADLTARTATEFVEFDGHGTHVAGIAAGNGRGTGNGQPAFRHVGVAPEAELIVVNAYALETQIVDACRYVFDRAGGRPAVINLSLGVRFGARDGTYVFDRSLSALTGPGRIISASAGNHGLELNHADTELAAGGQTDVQFNIPPYTPSSRPESVSIERWHAASAAFEIQLVGPSGAAATPWVPAGTTTGYVTTPDGTVLVENAVRTNGEPETSPRFARQILVAVHQGMEGTPGPRVGNWTVRVRRAASAASGRTDWWVTSFWFATGAGAVKAPFFVGASANSEQTILSPATGDRIIATGAYATKYRWANSSGGITGYGGTTGYPIGRIADFSSRGPRRDGVVRPDVVAPGYGVVAATSTRALVSDTYRDLDGVHDIRRGTSQASAHTTGVIALLLQQYPTLCPDTTGSGCHPTVTVRSLLHARARNDAFTTTHPCPLAPAGTCSPPPSTDAPVALPDPNPFYGHGKLSVIATVGAASPATSLVEPVVIGTPSGTGSHSVDANPELAARGFLVLVRDASGAPIPNAPVTLRFGGASGVRLASNQPTGIAVSCAARTLTMMTDTTGRASFSPRFGGFATTAAVEVIAATTSLGFVRARSPDRNALGGTADLEDFATFGAAFGVIAQPELDFDRSGGMIDLGDFAVFGGEFNAASMTYCP